MSTRRMRRRGIVSIFCLVSFAAFASRAMGQVLPIDVSNSTNAGGVYIDSDGTVRSREVDAHGDLAAMLARVRKNADAANTEKMTFISLPGAIAKAEALHAAGKPIPDEVKYLGGITQLRFVFVYPQTHDLIIGGPAEAIVDADSLEPVGKTTGRPVLHLDDFVVAMRTRAALGDQTGQAFGCSIDLPANAMQRSSEVMRQYANASQQERIDAMAKGIGPQTVRVFGTEADTRFAFVCVAADYKLKRICMGIDTLGPLAVGNAIDNSRPAGDRFWFEGNYQPLLVSSDDNAFELRGARLQVKAGELNFDTKGATPKAKQFAKDFSDKLPAAAAAVPLFADLQNIADMSLLAALIQHDKLNEKIGWDMHTMLDAHALPVGTVTVPKAADTLSCYRGGSIVAGGVMLEPDGWVDNANRESDAKGALTPTREAAQQHATTLPSEQLAD